MKAANQPAQLMEVDHELLIALSYKVETQTTISTARIMKTGNQSTLLVQGASQLGLCLKVEGELAT